MIRRSYISALLVCSFFAVLTAAAQPCPQVRISAERLPDLNVPRNGHSVLNLNGVITVFGGHTDGFIPTPTAEYFSDGQWHRLDMVYSHDGGMAFPLKSGQVLLAGGYEKNLGIGQTFEAEMYDPQSHTFKGFGCLDRKRTHCTALELDSGQVLITGNWYHDDALELFNGKDRFTHLKNAAQHRSQPYILRTARDDAYVFDHFSNYGKYYDSLVVDRLKGDAFTPDIFREWKPMHAHIPCNSITSFIGNEAQGRYAYLFAVTNAKGEVAIAVTAGADIRLLLTTCPVPTTCSRRPILYSAPVLVDRRLKRAYLTGGDTDTYRDEARHYVLRIDYGKAETDGAAPLTLYYTDPMPEQGSATPVLDNDGNLLLVGGTPIGTLSSNFRPSAGVRLLRFGAKPSSTYTSAAGLTWWQWLCIALVAVIAIGTFAYLIIYRKPQEDTPQTAAASPSPGEQLLRRIRQLVEDDKLYLDSELTTSMVAKRLGIHRNYVSECINSQTGCSFSQFVNSYRIEYAKRLIRQNPNEKISVIAAQAGFSNETSFYRTFKALTGKTPKDWIQEID